MQSKPLKQQVALVIDTMAMQGPVKKRDIIEELLRQTPDDYWCEGDRRDAKVLFFRQAVTTYFNEPLPPEISDRISVPDELRPALAKITRFICITAGGGADSEHVLSWEATPDQWDNNYHLKARVTEHATISRNEARSFRDLLAATGAGCLLDLITAAA